MLDKIKLIKESILQNILYFAKYFGKERLKKIIFLFFLAALVPLSFYISQDVLSGKIYLEIAAIVVSIGVIYFLKRPQKLFYFFIFSLILVDFPFTYKFDAINFANLIYLFLLFVLLFAGVIKNKITIIKTYLDLPIGLTMLVFAISIIQTRHVKNVIYIMKSSFMNAPYYRTIFQLILAIFIISSLYVTVSMLKNKEDIKKTIKLWIHTSALAAFLGLYGYFGGKIGLPFAKYFVIFDFSRVTATFKEPIFYSFYLATVIPLLYSLIINKSDLLAKRTMYFYFTLNLIALFFTGSRAGWIACIIAIIFVGLISSKKKKLREKISRFILSFVVIAILIGAIFFVSYNISSEAVNSRVFKLFAGTDFSAISRIDMMTTAWLIFCDYPILGAGLGNYYYKYLEYSPYYDIIYTWIGKYETPMVYPVPNNVYLSLLSETGILGLLPFLYIFFMLIKKVVSTIKNPGNDYWKPFLRGYLGCIIFALIVLFFISYFTYLFLWVMIGIILAIQRQCINEE